MNLLLVHQNFSGRFRHLAPALAQEGHTVLAHGTHDRLSARWQGVRYARYPDKRTSSPAIHTWAVDLETKIYRGGLGAFAHSVSGRYLPADTWKAVFPGAVQPLIAEHDWQRVCLPAQRAWSLTY